MLQSGVASRTSQIGAKATKQEDRVRAMSSAGGSGVRPRLPSAQEKIDGKPRHDPAVAVLRLTSRKTKVPSQQTHQRDQDSRSECPGRRTLMAGYGQWVDRDNLKCSEPAHKSRTLPDPSCAGNQCCPSFDFVFIANACSSGRSIGEPSDRARYRDASSR